MARDLGSLSWSKPGEGSGEAITGNSAGREAGGPVWLGVSLKRTRDPTTLHSHSSISGQEKWSTKEVGTERHLLPGAPPALGLDLKTQRAAEQCQGWNKWPSAMRWQAGMEGGVSLETSHDVQEEDRAGSQDQLSGCRDEAFCHAVATAGTHSQPDPAQTAGR